MNDWFSWAVGAAVLGFFGLLATAAWTDHTEKMECMKLRGDYIRGACVFRDSKPQ